MSIFVTNALNYLKQLEEAMRVESDGFGPEDIEHCDNLAEILQNLEFSIKKLHEELEIETIKASVFRHKITFFDSDLQREIDENVKAARDSNMETILGLKNKLEELTKKIEVLHKKDKQLSEEISQMEPEKRSLEDKHENIIKLLNDQMAHKALSQIKLNETRDLLRELNQNIVDLEEDMLNLNEKLIKERATARDIKTKLDDEKRETNAKAYEQEELNQAKLREVQEAKKAVQESNKSIRILFRENERYEQLNKELISEIENGTKQIERNQREYESLVTESLRLTTLEAKTQQDYNQNKTDTIRRTKETVERTNEEIENVKKLKEEQENKKIELKEIYERYKELQKINDAIKNSFEGIKLEIGEKYKEIGELEGKNQALYLQLGENQQAHSQVMDSLQREAEQCKDQLKQIRETRLIKQAERETKLNEIEAFNASLIIFQSSVDAFMKSNRTKTKELEEKEKNLNEIIGENDKAKDKLTTELDDAIKSYERMKSDLESNLNNLQKEYTFYMTENDKNTIELNDLEPIYQELCKNYREKCKDYEATRKSVIDAKAQKNNLENRILEIKKLTKEHDDSRDDLKVVLEVRRELLLAKMKEQKKESIELEDTILKTGLQLQTVKEQNNKFIEIIKNFEPEFKQMDNFTIEHLTTQDELEFEYQKLNEQLLNGWKSDEELKDFFKEHDNDLVDRLSSLLETTINRENRVGSVINKMYKELGNMENYLLKMIKKDPKEFHFIEEKK